MKCPNCNNEIVGDNLYCEFCGSEIRIVPDFEPEIENKMNESMSLVKDEFLKNHTTTVTTGANTEEPVCDLCKVTSDTNETISESDFSVSDSFEKSTTENEELWDEELDPSAHLSGFNKIIYFLRKKLYFKITIICILIVLLFSILALIQSLISNYRDNSYEYQLKMSQEAYDESDYTEASFYLEKAIVLQPSDTDMYLLADYYLKDNRTEICKQLLYDLINKNSTVKPDAYKKLISILENSNEYEEIDSLLSTCDDPDIVSSFSKYLASVPEFSVAEGTYYEIQPLKLTSSAPGTIYYTLDGKIPTTNSLIYTAPIFLESGEYTVKAIFVNEIGVVSDVVIRYYNIDISVPNCPEVNTYSGYFTVPEMITVEIPAECEVYYTTDNSLPTVNSILYQDPIPMPIGESYYNFCVVNSQGIVSEPTYRYFTLVPEAIYDVSEAQSLMIGEFLKEGKLTDPDGHSDKVSGRFLYECTGAISLDASCYYLFTEKYEDPTAQITKDTAMYYGVHVKTGEICLLKKNTEGFFEIDVSNIINNDTQITN